MPLFFALLLLQSCLPSTNTDLIDAEGKNLETRILLPHGYKRSFATEKTFIHYLRQIPLKTDQSPVLLYNGKEKNRQDVHVAVLQLSPGKKDLQQCADAVIRLRAEYLFAQKRYDDIAFHLTNGFLMEYKEWRKGKRIQVKGNHVSWVQKTTPSDSYESFFSYLEQVFTYAGTLSLEKELKKQSPENLQAGDVLVRGGSPGHAVIIMDVALHEKTGKKIFLLAQSYMPAQEIHVLKNPANSDLSPWYEWPEGETLETPEWDFSTQALKKF